MIVVDVLLTLAMTAVLLILFGLAFTPIRSSMLLHPKE